MSSTHPAIATVALHQPLKLVQVPTTTPQEGEVRIRVEWTASTPQDLHQADGGLFVEYPHVLGENTAGTVVEVGRGVQRLKIGDKVFGFNYTSQKDRAYQVFITAPEYRFGKVCILYAFAKQLAG